MAWTYTAQPYPSPWPYVAGEEIPQSCIDTVRFLIGDTDQSDPQLQDAEVTGLLTQNGGDPYQAGIEACRALATKYARQADKTVGDLHIAASQASKAYEAMVDQLQAQALRHAGPMVYAGGISRADKEIDRMDPDDVSPAFWEGMFDDPGTAADYGEFEGRNPWGAVP